MEVIGQFLATVCSTIFGTIFMVWLIAVAFDHMSSNKSMSLSRGVLNFSLKILGAAGKALLMASIPLVRSVGEKIVYVASYYLDKNKKPQIPSFQTPGQIPDAAGPAPPTPPDETTPSKKGAANSYDDPAEPEIIE